MVSIYNRSKPGFGGLEELENNKNSAVASEMLAGHKLALIWFRKG